MAVPLVYKSCLYEESLDKAIEDWTEISVQLEAQEEEKREWQAEQDVKKEEAEKTGDEEF